MHLERPFLGHTNYSQKLAAVVAPAWDTGMFTLPGNAGWRNDVNCCRCWAPPAEVPTQRLSTDLEVQPKACPTAFLSSHIRLLLSSPEYPSPPFLQSHFRCHLPISQPSLNSQNTDFVPITALNWV
uniref:Uncharacterized protein n=1 Tax=Molossus molossus TaxID=27622 RepID=A0A7J8BK73_MOLMO|nr:hypothetical protein HJG59_010148 [Molossus molossus]